MVECLLLIVILLQLSNCCVLPGDCVILQAHLQHILEIGALKTTNYLKRSGQLMS